MQVLIQFPNDVEEERALQILLHHSSGSMLPDRKYAIADAEALAAAGIRFDYLRKPPMPVRETEAISRERV